MSIPVTKDDLASRVEEYGGTAFVVSVGGEGRAKVVHVRIDVSGTTISARRVGRGTLRNIAANGEVTLLSPAPPGGEYSLILDGLAEPLTEPGDPEPTGLAIEFTGGVLHRPPD